jgi:prephenate dehydratase
MPEKMLTSAFFVDFIGSEKDEKIQKVLNEVSENTKDLRILGCYKEIKN